MSDEKQDCPPPRVELFATERIAFTSPSTDQKFELYVNLPHSYWYPEKRKRYAVLYSLNAQWDFQIVAGIYGNLNFDGIIEEIIIVGITWGGDYPDYAALANRDFTPTSSSFIPGSGGADLFLNIIKNEIIPFVEERYPVTADRGLVGSSNAGLFVLYAMLKETMLFQRIVVSSPFVQWDNDFLFKYEARYAEKMDQLAVKLFISWGEYEDVSSIKRFLNQLTERKYRSFGLEVSEVRQTGHAGNKPEGYARGMRSVYGRPILQLPTQKLKKYEGTYLYGTDRFIIAKDEHGLTIKRNNSETVSKIYANDENLFYVLGQYVFYRFTIEDEKVIEMNIELFNSTFRTQKIS